MPEKAAEDRYDWRRSAVCHNFNPTHEEFAEILAKPEKERADILLLFSQCASGLSLCIFQAVQDVLRETEWSEATDPHHLISEALWDESYFRDRKFAQLRGTGYSGKERLYEWVLYEWAKRAVPWKEGNKGPWPLPADSESLPKCIKVGDTWGTFMAFSRAWKAEASESSIKAMEQALWQMAEEGWRDELNKTLQDLGIREAQPETEDAQQEAEEAQKEIKGPPQETIPDIKKPLTKGDFRVWAISIEKFALACVAGLVVMSPAIVGIWKVASSVYAGKYWTALSWLPAFLFCVLFYRSLHRWYYDLDWEQQRIRKTMSE